MTARSAPPVLPLLADIEAGRTSPTAAFAAYAERIAAREPDTLAFAHLAIEAARADLPRQAGRGPLMGLPVGIKDIFDTADMPTAYGTTLYAGHRPSADAAIVAMCRRAGGSVIGKTATTAFANLDPAPTRNPRAPGHTPGGSSSGSAAAVAAGMVPFAVGTQTGGSVIRPASYCGIAGFKPSFKLLPATGMKTFSWNLDTVGLMAPTVADVAFFAEAVSGRPLRVDREAIVAPRRLGLVRVPDWSLAEPAMIACLEGAVRRAEAAGVSVVDLGAPPELQRAWDLHATIQNYEAARSMAYDVDRFGAQIPPLVYADLVAGGQITHDAYDEARGVASRARRASGRLFEQVDAILTFAAPGTPPAGLGATGKALFNRLWTLTGDPCVAVPGASDETGLPLGLQIVAPFGEDHRALAIAGWLESLIATD